jgi:hypothetical protein
MRCACCAGPSMRTLFAPAGYGKTTALNAAAAAQHTAGRHVLVLAPTHKAVAELRGAGLEAQTIARFLLHTDGTTLPRRTTVIVDEMSQVGTRHAAALAGIVAASPDAQLWCVGDVRQAQSVAAGGLAAKVEQLAAQGVIRAATLDQNRRQTDPADRQALAKLRAGDPADSRRIRTTHGWEHEHLTPVETRQALADAAVRDSDRHGTDRVAVLAVSHADCEDLTDRIRAARVDRGELRGPTIQGPGWGPEPRTYAAGDRILVHASLGAGRHLRVFNGSTGTITAIHSTGAIVLLDEGRQVRLPAAFVAGCRRDGTPNVSHGWARTVDGAQGGTWTQVHLLGTPSLDGFTGYVGQSRGQQPTHTWNTRPDADHPQRLLADHRTPGEAVVQAMSRDEPKTLAAVDDPWVLDRELRTERRHHNSITARRPRDQTDELDQARDELEGATDEHQRATQGVAHAEQQRARVGPLHRLRRGGRADINRADQALARADHRLDQATAALHQAHAQVERYEAAVAARNGWDRTHGWRLDRISEIDHTLAHHWANVTLTAVRADDPLAFGIDRLRAARTTYQTDLANLTNALPPDRRDQLDQAKTDLRQQQRNVRRAEHQITEAEQALDVASQRRWGRRDKPAIEHATAELRAAETNLGTAARPLDQAQQQVSEERDAVTAWTTAMRATRDQRHQLGAAIHDTSAALDHTRPQRIAAAALDPTHQLWRILGGPPPSRSGTAAWCGIAQQLELIHDDQPALFSQRSPGPAFYSPQEQQIATLLADAADIIHTANHLDPTPARHPLHDQQAWQPTVETAAQVLAAQRPAPAIDHDYGLGLGL